MLYTAYPLLPLTILQETQKLDFEGKRDRWNGYDPATYKNVIEEWNALDD